MSVAIGRMDPVISAVGTWTLTAIAVNSRKGVSSVYGTAVTMAVICGLTTLFVFVYIIFKLGRGRRIPWTGESV